MGREPEYLRAITWADPDPSLDEVEVTDQSLFDAMRDVSLRHAARLREMGPVRVLALDPCPLCGGTVLASEAAARCTSCGWRHRETTARTEL